MKSHAVFLFNFFEFMDFKAVTALTVVFLQYTLG